MGRSRIGKIWVNGTCVGSGTILDDWNVSPDVLREADRIWQKATAPDKKTCGTGIVEAGWRRWPGHANQGLEVYSTVAQKGMSLEEYERTIYRAMNRNEIPDNPSVCSYWTERTIGYPKLVGNRQRMTPVEYRMVGEPELYGANSIRIVGDVIIGRKRVGHWSTTIKRQYLDTVKENLCSGKEQEMSKSLFEVYVVNKGKFVDVWTGIASTGEIARFKALKELEIDADIEDLDIFTHQIGNLRDDCCK